MVQAAQRGCGVSILGGIENLTVHSQDQLAPSDPALQGVGLDISLDAFQPQPSCDLVVLKFNYYWKCQHFKLSIRLRMTSN